MRIQLNAMGHRTPIDIQIVWYKRDLRVADHAPLVEAARRGPVLPLYVVEPDLWRMPDVSGRHWSFVGEALVDLRADLARLGQTLVIRQGAICDVLATFSPFAGLWSHEETGNGWTFARDRSVADWCRQRGVPWTEIPQFGVFRRLRVRDGWARAWEERMAQPIVPPPDALMPLAGIEPGAIPDGHAVASHPDPCPGRQPGGRRAGVSTLESFLATRGRTYHRDLSSPVTAFAACSRLSTHLAYGSLSMREIVQRARAALPGADPVHRRAISAFVERLHWHCHFIQKLESEPRLEFENAHRAYDGLRDGPSDPARLAAWSNGETGWPLVDACMRALAATGWINFRMRAMLTAVASYHLWLPWRDTGLHLARQFTDYEPGIHWNQIQMQSGTTGINTVRIYNPVKQSQDHDPEGRFIRRWIPELARVPDPALHMPWTLDRAAQAAAGCVIGRDYPAPVVDHMAAAREARDRVWAVRRGETFHTEADRIQATHGSRRSGLPPSNPVRRRKAPSAQTSLDL
jgi:deoxyribodipyrimidine photo-lyase